MLYIYRVWDISTNFLIHHYLPRQIHKTVFKLKFCAIPFQKKGNCTKNSRTLIHFKGILSFTTYGAFVFNQALQMSSMGVRNKISSQFVIKNPHSISTIQYPYSIKLRDQSQYPTDFDLTSIRLNWIETVVWNGPLSAEDQLPSRITVWRYFGKIYWVGMTKLLLWGCPYIT